MRIKECKQLCFDLFLVHQILSKHRVIYLIRFNFQDVETDIIKLHI